MFELIGVSPETAEEDACRVEHYISEETFACMKAYFERMQG
jgi:Mn-dependent DtxR family transcriptional regulator